MSRNLILYLPYRIATVEGLMHALYLIWWVEEKQLSPAVVAAVLAAGDLAVAALELPTGWMADRFGHRASLIAGSAAQVCGMLVFWLGEGVGGLVLANLLVALGDALRSGAAQALLYRSCVAVHSEHAFQSIEARAGGLERVALVVLVVTGGTIVSIWGFAAGWIAETLLCGVGLVIACCLREPPPAVDEDPGTAATHVGLFSPRLLPVVLPAAVIGALASATLFVAQTTGDTRPASLTALVAFATLSEAAGSLLAGRATLTQRAHFVCPIAGVLAAALAVAVPPVVPVAAIGLSFLAGALEPLRATAIQRLTSDGTRARAASLASALDMTLSTVMLPLAGVLAGRRR